MLQRRSPSPQHLALVTVATGVVAGLAAAAGAGPFGDLPGHAGGIGLAGGVVATTPAPAPLRADALYPAPGGPLRIDAVTYVTDPPPPPPSRSVPAPPPAPAPAVSSPEPENGPPAASTTPSPDPSPEATPPPQPTATATPRPGPTPCGERCLPRPSGSPSPGTGWGGDD